MTQLQSIPLSKLKPSKLNVRKTGGKDVEQLAASIRAIGLQQNLGVLPVGKGFEVVFGGRRLRALQALAKADTLPESLAEGVPCHVLTESEAHEASLAENTVREAMHPLDQFAAFASMAEGGKPVADIAAAFGVSELVVNQRMRLSRVSPKLQKAYGAGEMTLEQLQAFAVTDDHAAQERTWKATYSDYDRRPDQLRRALLRDGIDGEHAKVKLVGLTAYEAAGGTVRRDLFSDAVVLLDEALLDRLVDAKLADLTTQLKAEGWSWVEVGERPAWNSATIEPDEREYTAAEHDAIDQAQDAGDDLAVDAIEEGARTWPEGAKERAGAIVHFGRAGLAIYRGILRDSASCQAADADDESGGDNAGLADEAPATTPAKAPSTLPARQIEALTRIRTGVLRDAMCDHPGLAIKVLTAHWAEEWRDSGYELDGMTIHHRNGPEASADDSDEVQHWKERLSFKGPVLDWLLTMPQTTSDALLAFLVAESVDIVQRTLCPESAGNMLCSLFQVDMVDHWRPDVEFLLSIPAAVTLQALREVGTPDVDRLAKLKKAELAGRAAELLRDTTWLPECLRVQQEVG